MKHFRHFSILASFAMLAAVGCSSTDTPLPPSNPHVTYVKGSSYTYTQQRLDTANGAQGLDKPDPSTTDTITSTVTDTMQPYAGKTNATFIVNSHSNGGANDTSFFSQNNSELWHYNYGLEALNNNQVVVSALGGKQIGLGWVLQAKLDAKQGDKWVARPDTTFDITVFGITTQGHVKIDATEQADTSIAVKSTNEISNSSAPVSVKHALLNITISTAAGNVAGVVDSYVSTAYGVVLNVVHTTKVDVIIHQQVSGSQLLMIKHP